MQASPNSPVDSPEVLSALAEASRQEGVTLLRLQGFDNIRTVTSVTGLPSIGLIKRNYDGFDVYITATQKEVQEVADSGASVVALDATPRPRPFGEKLEDLVAQAHRLGLLVLGDIDSVESASYAVQCGADMVSTTLAGYTLERTPTVGPDLEMLRQVVQAVSIPVLGEGRFTASWEVEAALRTGAVGVIVGGALNDPMKQTRALLPVKTKEGRIGAVDIGGTWLRFAVFNCEWNLLNATRVPNPGERKVLLQWIRSQIQESGVGSVGVSTGGVVDPSNGEVWMAKEYLMRDHVGVRFNEETLGVPTNAFGDGHATAWAHANRAEYAGKRVATLAIGTGVGAGFVREGKLWAGRKGEYPRINDLPTSSGESFESLLGGINLTSTPTSEQMQKAVSALEEAITIIRNIYFPDEIVVAGSVGLSSWMIPHLSRLKVKPSPFGPDAGLFGAASLTLYPTYL